MRKSIKSLQDAILEPEKAFYPTLEEGVAWYKLFNREIFEHALPRDPGYDNLIFEVTPLKNKFGSAAFYHDDTRTLELQMHHRFPNKRMFFEVLSHEMVHLYQIVYENKIDHGPSFWAWKPILAKYHLGLQTKYHRIR